ncbi:MAG: hypothetical protein NT120_04390 [Candidatus Aenigmarchaeota archaeon]|nr:hypothetical protein [Candidatus Aenigmarchaeota archaeon]
MAKNSVHSYVFTKIGVVLAIIGTLIKLFVLVTPFSQSFDVTSDLFLMLAIFLVVMDVAKAVES